MNVALQSNIYKAQNVMLSMPQAETETKHHFADGIYARELFIPAGVCLVGALHKTNHLFTVSQVLIDNALVRQETRGSHWREDYPESMTDFEVRLVSHRSPEGGLITTTTGIGT